MSTGLSKIRLHDLRHTSASLGLEAGESLKEVSDRLTERVGHSSIVITADTYAHIAPELAERSAEQPAGLIAAPPALDGR
jgi:integrase